MDILAEKLLGLTATDKVVWEVKPLFKFIPENVISLNGIWFRVGGSRREPCVDVYSETGEYIQNIQVPGLFEAIEEQKARRKVVNKDKVAQALMNF